MRLKILRIIIATAFLIIVLDLIYVQLIRGFYYHRLSINNRIRVIPFEGKRGRILDRNGVVLADNRISFDVMVTPQEMTGGKEELFALLSQVLGLEPEILWQRFNQKRSAPFAPVVIAEDISRHQVFLLEENRFRFPSLLIQENYRRLYPAREIGSHALGYVSKASPSQIQKLKAYGYTVEGLTGYAGVEEYYDAYLQGESGGLQVEVNSRGQQVRLLGIREPQSGKDVQLTIDSRIQRIAVESLQGATGTVIVMDMDTGEILGMVSSPAYDPNIFSDAKESQKTAAIFADPSSPMLNRAIKGLYPPGSVFKLPLAFAGLSNTLIDTSTTFECHGYFQLGQRQIRCVHTHGPQRLIEAIAHSCNVYFINTGLKVESDLMAKYARQFGLGQLTHIDLPFESGGLIPSQSQRRLSLKKSWYKGDTANLAIGQGEILVTPLQLLRMLAIIGRNGMEIQPFMVKAIDNQDVKRSYVPRRVAIDQKIFQIIKEGLHAAVTDEHGTARVLNIPGLFTAGKTGTAQSAPLRNHHAWFVGYTLSDKRRIVYCVFLEYGGSSYYATRAAYDMLVKMQKENII